MIHNQDETAASGDRALQKLIDGNDRYVSAKTAHPNQTPARRAEVLKS